MLKSEKVNLVPFVSLYCSLNVRRQCVRAIQEECLGPLMRKEKANDRISKLMERIRPERKLPSSHHHSQIQISHHDKVKKSEEDSGALTDGENGQIKGRG